MAGRKPADGEAVWWLRMGDEDRERYGGPEWVAFDVGRLFKMPASQLTAFESETDMFLFVVLYQFASFGAAATRAALFIARRQAGVDGEKWAEFDPQPLQVKRRTEKPVAEADRSKAGRGKGRTAPSPPGSEGEASTPSSTT